MPSPMVTDRGDPAGKSVVSDAKSRPAPGGDVDIVDASQPMVSRKELADKTATAAIRLTYKQSDLALLPKTKWLTIKTTT